MSRTLLVALSALLGAVACEAVLGLRSTHAARNESSADTEASGRPGAMDASPVPAGGSNDGVRTDAAGDGAGGESGESGAPARGQGGIGTGGTGSEPMPAAGHGGQRGGSDGGEAGAVSPGSGGSWMDGGTSSDGGVAIATGGQAPAGIPCGATECIGAGVCARGQTCVDARWAAWPMPNPSALAAPALPDDATPLPHAASYDTTASEVVEDRVTGLMWQADVAGPLARADATHYCDALELGGYDDFRLPSRVELASLVDFSRHDPAIDTDAFPATPAVGFWTASVLAGDSSSAFGVSFALGVVDTYPLTTRLEVRCVR